MLYLNLVRYMVSFIVQFHLWDFDCLHMHVGKKIYYKVILKKLVLPLYNEMDFTFCKMTMEIFQTNIYMLLVLRGLGNDQGKDQSGQANAQD